MSALIARALAGDGSALLNRVQAEDGLARLVGRPAVQAALRGLDPGAVTAGHEDGRLAVLIASQAQVWARLEGAAIAELTIIAARPPSPDAAAALAARHPCHRPLGELASGRGQLLDAPSDPLAAVLAALWPDAQLLPRARIALPDGGTAGLFQLLADADGRRISLPVAAVQAADGSITPLHDALALAAAPLRPFWQD